MDDNTKLVQFRACRFLDFEPHYGNCKRQLISVSETKLCWKRTHDLVQFCSKRGRINSPAGCLTKATAGCNDYEGVDRDIEVPIEELES